MRIRPQELRWITQELEPRLVAAAVAQREAGVPLQYVLKSQPFGPLSIRCEPGALIPRWETEEWVTTLANEFKVHKPRILDLCTGTGCVLFLLCHLLNGSGFGTDISPEAAKVFVKNQDRLNMLENTRLKLISVFETLPSELRSVDLVVANPPYILSSEEVEPQVKDHEPSIALYETPGIWEALVNRVGETSAQRAVFEVGNEGQIESVIKLFKGIGWSASGSKDSAGNWRTVWARPN